MRRAISLATIALAVPAAAHAASPVEILISDAGQEDETGAVLVDLRLLNDSGDPQGMENAVALFSRLIDRAVPSGRLGDMAKL